MVKLNRIYTKTGDDGSTVLGDGTRTAKTDPRVAAYGTTDEANAALGLAVLACQRQGGAAGELASVLASLQHDLFDCGADLCTPVDQAERDGTLQTPRLRIIPEQTARVESLIDRYNADLEPLESFVLPGGSEAAAALHLARTVVRRAERQTAALLEAAPEATSAEVLRYLNRVGDLLFVLARVASPQGEVLWKPGSTRPKD